MKNRLLLFALFTLVVAQTAHAQNPWYGADSAEKRASTLVTPISISQTISGASPFKVAIATGTGAKFSPIPTPFILTCAPAAENASTPIEEFVCSAVSNDTLTLIKRSLSNTTAKTWAVGSYIGYRLSALQFKQIQGRIDSLALNSGTVSSIAVQSPLTGGTITSSGTIALPMATNSQSGYLSSAEHATLFAKQNAMGALSPIFLSGVNIGIQQADATHDGYMTSALYNTIAAMFPIPDTSGVPTTDVLTPVGWSSAGSGTVTSVAVNGGASGLTFSSSAITSTGAISITGGVLGIGYGGTGGGTRQQGLANLLPDSTGHTGEFLRVDSTGDFLWRPAGGGSGGSGTVTSVNVAVPSVLSVSGGPITTSGTITLGYSGTALPYSSGGTGQIAWTKGDLLYASNTNTLAKLAVGSSGQVLTVGSGLPAWTTSTASQITRLGMTVPAGFSVDPLSTITSDTFNITIDSMAANMVLATPDGSGGTATFRSLVTGDIPSLDVAQITSGAFSTVRGGTGIASPTIHKLLVGNGASAMTQLAVGATATVLHGNTGADPSFSAIVTADITDSNVTAVKIATHAVDLTQQVSGILPAANGGTGNGFTAFTGPATSTKTFTLPNASATLAYLAGGQTFTGGLTINGGLTLGTALPLTSGGTGATTQAAALKAVTPDSTGKGGKALGVVNGGGYDWITPGFASPMTTTGDIIYSSDNSGTATRLGIGSSGQVLTVNAGLPSWQPVTALTNPMTTTGDMIYSSSGSTPARLAAGTAGQFLIGGPAPTWGSTLLAAAAGLGSTSTDGLVLKDSTAATVGATTMYSPRLRFTGSAYKSSVTAASQTDDWIIENQPVTGTSTTTANLVFSSQINAGGYASKFTIGSDASLSLGASKIFSSASTLASGVTASSLTSVGTLTSATWHATPITEVYGGTGQTSYATGDILYASGTSSLTTRAIGPDNTFLGVVAGTPDWVAPLNPYGFIFGSTATLTVGVTSAFFSPFGAAQTSSASEDATHEMLVVSPCQATNLYLQTNAAPGAANQHTMQMYRSTDHGATWSVTPLTVTIMNLATSAQDIIDTVSLSAGDLISIEDHSTVASSATAGTWGMHLIEPTSISGVYNTVTASTSVTSPVVSTDQMLSIQGTPLDTANNSVGSQVAATYAGRVKLRNRSGGILGTLVCTINNSKLTSSSVIFVSTERDAGSSAGIEYVANVTAGSRVVGTSFQVDVQRKTTGSVGNDEGCVLNYIIVN